MSNYVKPEDVISPKGSIEIKRILHAGSEGTFAIAEIIWDGDLCLGIRWNGTDEQPLGHPSSRGYATWTVVGEDIVKILTAYHLNCLIVK